MLNAQSSMFSRLKLLILVLQCIAYTSKQRKKMQRYGAEAFSEIITLGDFTQNQISCST